MDTDSSSELDNSDSDEICDLDSDEICDLDVDETLIYKDSESFNVVNKLFNRQLFGRFAKNSRSKTEKVYTSIPARCHVNLADILPRDDNVCQQIFMGFSQCGRFLISYCIENIENPDVITGRMASLTFFILSQFTLNVWSYVPHRPISHVASYKIFRHCKTCDNLQVTMCQWPTDMDKLVIYGTCDQKYSEAYLTIVTLPPMQKCKDCNPNSTINETDVFSRPAHTRCVKHGVSVDLMLSVMSRSPKFKPRLSLAYPDYVILNTGHYLYALNVSLSNAPVSIRKAESFASLASSEFVCAPTPASQNSFPDNISDISESISIKQDHDNTSTNKIVSEIIADFSDSETECSDYSKPFHELNISCDPLNVTGRSYWTMTSVPEPSIIIPRLKSFLKKRDGNRNNSSASTSDRSNQNIPEKSKIAAEKAYEFTEETEKCEKLSLFRKKRLAEKKYEFSEDNCENIIPFNLLRYERRFFGKGLNNRNQSNIAQEIQVNGCFLSPRSPGLHSPRSPMMSPNSRNSPFSPGGSRHVYNRLVSPSQLSRKSPLSPRGEINHLQKYDVYSPSHIDSDDNDSKLVLRQMNKIPSPRLLEFTSETTATRNDTLVWNSNNMGNVNEGLLIMDEKDKTAKSAAEKPKWIKEIIRRYSNFDYESASSLVSDSQRGDDCVSFDPPVLVHLNNCGEEEHFDAVPSYMIDDVSGPIVTVTHRTFDAEQFCHRTAKKICSQYNLKFTHCADYDIEILNICPLTGDVICSAYIEIGVNNHPRSPQSGKYSLRLMFVWSAGKSGGGSCITTEPEPQPVQTTFPPTPSMPVFAQNFPKINSREVRVMTHHSDNSLTHLRDEENLVDIVYDSDGDF